MNKLIAFLLAAFTFTNVSAQTLKVTGEITGDGGKDKPVQLYIQPMESLFNSPPSPVEVKDNKFITELNLKDGFIFIGAVVGQTQYMLPYYKEGKGGELSLPIVLDKGIITVKGADHNNRALGGFNAIMGKNRRKLWLEGKELSKEAITGLLKELGTASDSVCRTENCSPTVQKYINIWAYNTMHDLYENISFFTGKSHAELGAEDRSSFLAPPQKVLDCDMACYFANTPRIVASSLPEGDLATRIGALYKEYRSDNVKKAAQEAIINEFIVKFDYAKNYQDGLEQLTALSEKYKLPESYLKAFRKRKATIPGNPFPEGVTMTDLNGNKVDFSKFRGKYVYIDMWASWCAPCIREIPHLKKLEEEVKNENVVFLSLSIDTNEESWKKKVKELDLKGNLLIDSKNELPKALGVSGIPFFVIYDKEGKLYKYNAPRPSDANVKEMLEQLR